MSAVCDGAKATTIVVKPASVLTLDTGFRRFRAQRFGQRQCRQEFGGVAGQQRRGGQLEAREDAAYGSGKTGFLFRIGLLHRRFGGGRSIPCQAAKRRSNSTVKLGTAVLVREPSGPWSARSANCSPCGWR